MRQVLTRRHQSRRAGTGRLMMQTLVNDGQCKTETVSERKREGREREGLLGLIASSLCREDKQKDYRVHFSRVTLFLPDFIPGTDQ